MNEFFNESAGVPIHEQVAPNRWMVTIARPGKGSSGSYSSTVLKEYGASAFPAGTKAFWNHDPKRDARDMVGTYDEGAFWDEDAQELRGVLTVFPRYTQVVNEAKHNIEASIHAAMLHDKFTREVKELLYDRSNTVDLVSFAGLEGSGIKYAVESLFAEAAADGDNGKEEENNVEIEKEVGELKLAVEALVAKFDTFATESKTEAQGVADEAAVDAAALARAAEILENYATAEESIDKADILASQKTALKVRARKGEDITEALAEQVAFAAEARKEFTPEAPAGYGRNRGTVVIAEESRKDTDALSFSPIGWKN